MLPIFAVVFLVILVYSFTTNPLSAGFRLQFALICITAFIVINALSKRKNSSITETKRFIFLTLLTVLSVVAATGWFFSPFFFSLYLLTILLSFTFSTGASVAFVLTLIVLFSFNIGEVDLAYDYLVILSLLTTVPLSVYLRKEYMRLQESKKEILVLEKEKKNFENQVDAVLANRINSFAINLRQPINDIKQITYMIQQETTEQKRKKDWTRILSASEEALHMIKLFEEETTGKKLSTSLKTS